MIRLATAADLPEIVRLGRLFHAGSHWADVVAFDADRLRDSAEAWLASDSAAVFLTENAIMVVLACPLHFSTRLVAQELAFWAPDGSGNALRSAAETWAADRGVEVVLMGAAEPGPMEAMSRWYRMGGYVPFGRSFMKVL